MAHHGHGLSLCIHNAKMHKLTTACTHLVKAFDWLAVLVDQELEKVPANIGAAAL